MSMAATAEFASAPDAPAAAPVDLGGRCDIMPGSPLPDLDSPGGEAFVARVRRDRKSDQFAIIVDGRVPARIEALPAFRGMEHPNVLRVLDWGTVDWPLEDRRRFAIVFERPAGRRLMESLDDVREPLPDDVIVRGLLPAMLSVLRDMNMRGVTSGALRPTNLFFRDPASGGIVLGDCVSSPAGYGQPLLLETIERGMAQPSGRGPGLISDDLYALGVTLLILSLGRNPLRGMEEDAALRAKMDKGTYPALTAGVRVPQSLIEPLRGLMADDGKQRWSLSDLEMWLQGRRLSPKQPQVPRRGARPFEFGGDEHWHCRALARGMAANPAAAAPVIERGDLDKWLRRSLGDEARADLVQNAIDSASIGGRGSNQEDRTVARVVTALDPPAPLRYRGIAVMPDGVGTALAEAVCTGASVQPLAELILAQLPMFWVSCQTDFRAEHVPLVQLFDLQRTLLEHTGPGFGIERLLYELNPACPCQSPLVRDQHVLTMAELMAALNTVAARPARGRDPMDRHIAAFIAAQHKKINDQFFTALTSADPARRMTATLRILAEVQNRFGPANLPQLCDWLVSMMEPAFKRFKHRPTREKLKEEARLLAREGVIEKLVRLVDNPDAIRHDDKGFLAAIRQHEALTKEIQRLEARIRTGGSAAEGTGRRVAAVISNVLAMGGLILTVVMMAG